MEEGSTIASLPTLLPDLLVMTLEVSVQCGLARETKASEREARIDHEPRTSEAVNFDGGDGRRELKYIQM